MLAKQILIDHATEWLPKHIERLEFLDKLGAPTIIAEGQRKIVVEYESTIAGTSLFEFSGAKKFANVLDETIIEQYTEMYKDYKNGKCARIVFTTNSGKYMWMPATKTLTVWKADKYLKK